MNTKISLISEADKLKASYATLSPFWQYFYPSRLKFVIENTLPNTESNTHRIIDSAIKSTWFFQRWIFTSLSHFFQAPVVKETQRFYEDSPFLSHQQQPVSIMDAMCNYKRASHLPHSKAALKFNSLLSAGNMHSKSNERIIILLNELGLLSTWQVVSNLNNATTTTPDETFLKLPYGARMIALLEGLKNMPNLLGAQAPTIQSAFEAEVVKANLTLAAQATQQRQELLAAQATQRQAQLAAQATQRQAQLAAQHLRQTSLRLHFLGGDSASIFFGNGAYAPLRSVGASSIQSSNPLGSNDKKLTDIGFDERCLTTEEKQRYDDYLCKINYTIMSDPVHTADCPQQNYERAALTKWVTQKGQHPVTKNYLSVAMLQPNLALKAEIDQFVDTMVSKAAAAPSFL